MRGRRASSTCPMRGVRTTLATAAVADAQERRTAALAARADGISAKGALEADQFVFLQRQTRSNKVSEAMVGVIVEFWHGEEVSRGNGNTSDVKKASKHRDAAQHPAQVQIRTAADAVQRRTAYS
eukprot:TRINITY_DN7262_c0_g1_i4.p1 TRINITY_DN7262_c0_g1~~TRINITY_DN7262_c0_g1_i4.p1  ORF type:complete len:125 (-),score=12.15 TRINITY_DN7262_c0_g1_i4:3-377(-)